MLGKQSLSFESLAKQKSTLFSNGACLFIILDRERGTIHKSNLKRQTSKLQSCVCYFDFICGVCLTKSLTKSSAI